MLQSNHDAGVEIHNTGSSAEPQVLQFGNSSNDVLGLTAASDVVACHNKTDVLNDGQGQASPSGLNKHCSPATRQGQDSDDPNSSSGECTSDNIHSKQTTHGQSSVPTDTEQKLPDFQDAPGRTEDRSERDNVTLNTTNNNGDSERPSADADSDKKDLKCKLPRPEEKEPCPRCVSMDTKFCYYNNYNQKQPRFFCKACQRYWTAGGTLRNIAPGSGRRKSKAATKDAEKNALVEFAKQQGVFAAMPGSNPLAAYANSLNPLLADPVLAYGAASAQQQLLNQSALSGIAAKLPGMQQLQQQWPGALPPDLNGSLRGLQNHLGAAAAAQMPQQQLAGIDARLLSASGYDAHAAAQQNAAAAAAAAAVAASQPAATAAAIAVAAAASEDGSVDGRRMRFKAENGEAAALNPINLAALANTSPTAAFNSLVQQAADQTRTQGTLGMQSGNPALDQLNRTALLQSAAANQWQSLLPNTTGMGAGGLDINASLLQQGGVNAQDWLSLTNEANKNQQAAAQQAAATQAAVVAIQQAQAQAHAMAANTATTNPASAQAAAQMALQTQQALQAAAAQAAAAGAGWPNGTGAGSGQVAPYWPLWPYNNAAAHNYAAAQASHYMAAAAAAAYNRNWNPMTDVNAAAGTANQGLAQQNQASSTAALMAQAQSLMAQRTSLPMPTSSPANSWPNNVNGASAWNGADPATAQAAAAAAAGMPWGNWNVGGMNANNSGVTGLNAAQFAQLQQMTGISNSPPVLKTAAVTQLGGGASLASANSTGTGTNLTKHSRSFDTTVG